MTKSQRLIADYLETGSEPAFRELVSLYIDLVYSAAYRLVKNDAHLAEDVAQAVFIDLARMAKTLPSDVMLGGWLHRHTCFIASKAIRGERRRQFRERQAVEINALQGYPEFDFKLVAPLLDEAINELDDLDRKAVLLRFFEKSDFGKIGEAIGSSADSARMRVNRALEKMELILNRKGVKATAGALAVALTANAIQSAPFGYAASISAAALAGTAGTVAGAIAVTKTIAMTTIQKTLIASVVATLAGAGIYEVIQAGQLRNQNHSLEQNREPLIAEIKELQRERNDLTNRVALMATEIERFNAKNIELMRLRGEVTRLMAAANDPEVAAENELLAKVKKLKQRLQATPTAQIPELIFLTEKDWLDAAEKRLESDADYRRALAALRTLGKKKFCIKAQKALNAYLKANDNQLPTDMAQLQPYCDPQVNDSMLNRWNITVDLDARFGGGILIAEIAPVDEVFDEYIAFGTNGQRVSDVRAKTYKTLEPAYTAYSVANAGRDNTNIVELLPYATTPEQKAAVQNIMLFESELSELK